MIVDYNNKNKIYMCHFPGNAESLQEKVFSYVKNKKFKIDSKISVIAIATKDHVENSCLNKQGININIISNKDWKNIDKINYIYELLKKCKTEYCIITDVRDVIITADLDNEFINKFKSYDCDIVYNATISKFPKVNLQSDYLIDGRSGKFRYLNAGLCFGKTSKLLEWYKYLSENIIDSKSEQFILRKLYIPKFNIKIDGNRKLFRNCHWNDTVWFKGFRKLYLDYGEPIESKQLKYKYLLPNGKIISGKIKEFDIINEPIYILKSSNLYNLNNISVKGKCILRIYIDSQINFELLKKYNFFTKIEFVFCDSYEEKGFADLINKILLEPKLNCVSQLIIKNFPKNIILPLDERVTIKENNSNIIVKMCSKNRYFFQRTYDFQDYAEDLAHEWSKKI